MNDIANVLVSFKSRSPICFWWIKWLGRRLAAGAFVLFGITIFVFLATQALPSDPAHAILGEQATPEAVNALRIKLGLDLPLYEQYWAWLSNIFRGDFGVSLGTSQTVSAVLGYRLINSLSLLTISASMALPIALGFGVLTAVRRDGALDRVILTASMMVASVPDFVIALTLVLIFSTTVFHLLPAVSFFPSGELPFLYPVQMILPVATMVIVCTPYLFRLFRASMIEALDSDYVLMARLKGMPERVVIFKHALINALVPGVQAGGLVLSGMLAGVIIIEFVFRYPGLGSALSQAIGTRDLPVIQAVVLIYASAVVLFNMLADILTVLLTPRLRTGGR